MKKFEDMIDNFSYVFISENDINQTKEEFIDMCNELETINHEDYIDYIKDIREIFSKYGFIEKEFFFDSFDSLSSNLYCGYFVDGKIKNFSLYNNSDSMNGYVKIDENGKIDFNQMPLLFDFRVELLRLKEINKNKQK